MNKQNRMRLVTGSLLAVLTTGCTIFNGGLSVNRFSAGMKLLPPPAQDQGLPYTRSSAKAAQPFLKKCIAFSPLSRYAYVYGKKVRIDNVDKLRGEPVIRDGKTFIPLESAGLLALTPDSEPVKDAPSYLKGRWRYEFELPHVEPGTFSDLITVKERLYVNVLEAATHYGLSCCSPDSRLLMFSKELCTAEPTAVELKNLLTQLDTPEKYVDPQIATEFIPQLARQGEWQTHVKLEPGDEELLEGPEKEWAFTPRSEYDLTGFNHQLLGTPATKPGVYPRILFTEDDLPSIRQRIKDNAIARRTWAEMEILLQKTWLNPGTDTHKLFTKLETGNTEDLKWDPWKDGRRIPYFPRRFEGYNYGIHSSHVFDNSQILSTIALYALLKDDDALGIRAAKAIANLYRLQEPNLDKYLEFSDSEFGSNSRDANGSTTQWRGMHYVVAHMDMPFCLDFAGKWMDDKDKEFMIRFISKSTYGRRNNGGDGPRKAWRDINHMTWHLTHLLALAAIEGTEGFDEEGYLSSSELTHDFLEFGISPDGTVFESNGKSSGGNMFLLYSMIALARRGNNLWGHPHFRNFMRSQAQNTSPNGKTTITSGTWSGFTLAAANTMIFHSFYPQDRSADYLLCNPDPTSTGLGLAGFVPSKFNEKKYREQLMKNHGNTRLPSPQYPAFTLTLLYDTDWKLTKRADLEEGNNFIDTLQGHMSAYSEQDDKAIWMHMQVRPNHYLGAGHHHADAGMFHFSSGGVNWITESEFQKIYDGKYHNQVLIDGIAQPDGTQGRAKWLGALCSDNLTLATTDLKDSYSYRIQNQFIYFDTDMWGARPDQYEWTLYKDQQALSHFKGTQRYKMRPWWPSGVFSNWFPVLKRDFNTVQYAFRSSGLIKGDYPYGIVVDDIKKDDKIRLYQFSAMPGPGVWAASNKGYDLPVNQLVLAQQGKARHHAGKHRYRPRKGDPLLLVVLLGGEGAPATFETGSSKRSRFALNPYGVLNEEEHGSVQAPIRIATHGDGPHWNNGDMVQLFYDQIRGGCYSKQAHFRTLLIPFNHGDKLPVVSYDKTSSTATVVIGDQKDTLVFSKNCDQRTTFELIRNGKKLESSSDIN